MIEGRMHLRGWIGAGVGLVVLVLLGSCGDFVGAEAPNDALHFPTGIAIHPTGRYVYVVSSNFDVAYTSKRGGTVTVIDADTLEIVPESTVQIGSFGGQATLSQDARHLYVAVRGDQSVVRLDVSEDGRTLSCQGGRDGLPCRLDDLPTDPYAVLVEEGEVDLEVGGPTQVELLVVGSLLSNAVTAISIKGGDPNTAVRLSADVTRGGSAFARHPRTGYYYAVGGFDDRVRIFLPVIGREGDVSALYSLGSISLSNPTGNYDARGIAFTSDGDRAFVAARNPQSILVLDTSPSNRETGGGSRDQLVGQIDLDAAPEAIAVVEEADGETVYAVELGGDSLVVVDPRNEQVVGRFHVGSTPASMAVDLVRHDRLYVTLFGEDAVAVVDLDPTSRRYRTTVAKVR